MARYLIYNYDLAFAVNGTTSWHTKVDRADKHIRELEEVIKEYFSAANPSILWTFDDAVDHWEARLQLPFDLPAEVGVIVGDIIHNLRSALDARMFQILSDRSTAALGTGRRVPTPSRYAFPVCKNLESLRKGDWHQQLGDEVLFQAVKHQQPFAYVDEGATPPTGLERDKRIESHPLSVLHSASIVDKHHAVHATLCFMKMVWMSVPNGTDIEFLPGDPRPWADGSVVIRARITKGDRSAKLSPDGRVGVTLAANAASTYPVPLIGGMRILQSYVVAALEALKKF